MSTLPRRLPRQPRGERRVAGLLSAAASVIASSGYDAATMCSIAERAGASIGSLYQFFPNKDSLVSALCEDYAREINQMWASLQARAGEMTLDELVDGYVAVMVEFLEGHPEFLPLMDSAPTRCVPGTRELLRDRLAGVLRSHKPRLNRRQAVRIADVMLHINKGLMSLYARTDREAGDWVVAEIKSVLGAYLADRLGA